MSEPQWVYIQNRQQMGPVGQAQLQQMATTGVLKPWDSVWTDGMPVWKPAGSVPLLFPTGVSMTPATVPLEYATEARFAPKVRYGGFWLRLVAFLIDSVLLSLIVIAIAFVLGLLFEAFGVNLRSYLRDDMEASVQAAFQLIIVLISWLYFATQESGPKGATPGKSLLGLHVTDVDGSRITFRRATTRHFSKIISLYFTLTIGYLMAAFTKRKQTLHDLMAGCLVVK